MGVKRTKRSTRTVKRVRSTRSRKAAATGAASNYAWMTSSRAIVSGMICIVVAAALLSAREPTPRVDVEGQVSTAAMAVAHDTEPPVKETATAVAKASPAAVSEIPAPTLVQTVDVQHEPEAQPEAESPTVVTITGCVERDEGTFRLADAAGENAPTSRSWRSGFLRKRSSHVELADAVGTLGLRNHVGRRVSVTGRLIDRELRAHAMRLVGTCD